MHLASLRLDITYASCNQPALCNNTDDTYGPNQRKDPLTIKNNDLLGVKVVHSEGRNVRVETFNSIGELPLKNGVNQGTCVPSLPNKHSGIQMWKKGIDLLSVLLLLLSKKVSLMEKISEKIAKFCAL